MEGLSRELILSLLDQAETYATPAEKIPTLHGHTVCNLFFEPSTRTRTTFELAAKRLSADVLNLQVALAARARARPCSTR